MKKEIEIKIGNVFAVKQISENKEVDDYVDPLYVYSTNKKDCLIVVKKRGGAEFLCESKVYSLMQKYGEIINNQVKFIYYVALAEEYKGEEEVRSIYRYSKNSEVTVWWDGVHYSYSGNGGSDVDFRLPEVNGWYFRVGDFNLNSAKQIINKYKEENKIMILRQEKWNRILDEQLTKAANA